MKNRYKLALTLVTVLSAFNSYSQTTEVLDIKTILPVKQDVFATVKGLIKATTDCSKQKTISFEHSIEVLNYYTSIPDSIFQEPSKEDISEAVMQTYSPRVVRNLKDRCKKQGYE